MRVCAENESGLKPGAEATESLFRAEVGRGAFPHEGRVTERRPGHVGSENAGMSSDKGGENPPRRKPKGSWGRLVLPG
jgi:hypothetical protein